MHSIERGGGVVSLIITFQISCINNRVVCKVKKEQHQNPEFGPKLGEIAKKKTCKKVH